MLEDKAQRHEQMQRKRKDQSSVTLHDSIMKRELKKA
jgi:hypothetical protein